MEQFNKILNDLQTDTIKVLQHLSRLIMAEQENGIVTAKRIDDYLCELENLCVKSRNAVDNLRPADIPKDTIIPNRTVFDIAGNVEMTNEGWLHITLNALLPNCKYRISDYIGDTIARLIQSYEYDLPYFERAFLAIVEFCNHDNHNALDCDNKGWKMIPNALKGGVIEDDSQFVLSIGLFSELSEDVRCEIYLMPPEDGGIFMEMLNSNLI